MTAASNKTSLSIASAEWLMRPATQAVFTALTTTGHRARAVGGCVRDTLLATLEQGERTDPRDGVVGEAADIDIATTSPPEETIRLAEQAGLRAIPTGLNHGTITILSEATPYEVTTLRHDVETYGRHANVAFTDDWAIDAARRDFTINALYANPDGSIFDPLKGLPDLLARRVRFVGDPHQRIREDYLRILRFFRFFARFGTGTPEADSLKACVSERDGLARLSRERIGHELLRLLVAPGAAATIRIMAENGLLTEVLPVAPIPERFARYAALEAELAHELNHGRGNAPPSRSTPDPAMRLAALTVATEEDATRLAAALRLSNDQVRTVSLWAKRLSETKRAQRAGHVAETTERLKQRLYWVGAETYQRTVLIDASLDPEYRDIASIANDVCLPKRWTPPRFPINGSDLKALGLSPGRQLGDWLSTLEQDWVASGFMLNESELKQRVTHALSTRRN